MTTEANKAVPNPAKWKLPTKALVISRIMALMINVNNPNVKILMGNVNKSKKGLIKVLSKPKTIAASTSAPVLSNQIPGNKISANHNAAELIKIFRMMSRSIRTPDNTMIL